MPEDVEVNEGEVSDGMSEYDDTEPHLGDDDDDDKMGGADIKNEDGTGGTKKIYDAKDPLRPRRKKARRACYACQRAHLTCGTHASLIAAPPPPLHGELVLEACGDRPGLYAAEDTLETLRVRDGCLHVLKRR